MAKVKVEIEVDQVLTTAVALELEPGDKLLVMNGIVVGMVEKRPGPINVPATTNILRRSKSVSKNDKVIEQRIIELLRQNELTANELAVYIKRDNNGKRLSIGDIMSHLRERKVIEPINKDRFPIYRLTQQS